MSKMRVILLNNRGIRVALSALLLGFLLPVVITKAALPTDFQTSLIASGLEGPAGLEIAPDGRVFVLERAGTVKIIKNGVLLSQPFVVFDAVASGDRGLIGIDFDPDFGVSNFWVYFYYTGQDLLNHVVRYDASTDLGLQGPLEIFSTDSPSQQLHVGGTIQFGLDGMLYFAVGDNGYPPNSQNLNNPHGKILRINKDGTIPTDNPFYGQPDKLDAIWAYGFRNPWRFQFDQTNGALLGADVGDYSWEEVNKIVKGGNYGWPLQEGYCTQVCDGFIDPIIAYEHKGVSAAVTGGPIYHGAMFPAEYDGSYFFGDYAQGFIKRATFNPDGSVDNILDFETAAGSVVDMKIADDGSMYYITYYPGNLYRVHYNKINHAPSAVSSADMTTGDDVPFLVNFSSAGTTDTDGDSLNYLWDFGDGSTSNEQHPSHTYTIRGSYTVGLTVSDTEYTSQATPLVIQVGLSPLITIATPVDDTTYRAGDSISYSLSATDATGSDMADANISTDIIFHHDTHMHPFIENQIGKTGSFTIPNTGESSANTWYELVATATDDLGISSTKSVTVHPETIQMSFSTQPAGLEVRLDGVPHAAPYSIEQVIGFKRELSAKVTQVAADGTVYQFKEWSDGGALRNFYTTPSQNTNIAAVFVPVVDFMGEYYANQDLSGTPAATRNDPIINFAWGLNAPMATLPLDNFSIRWSRTQYFAEGRYEFTTATDDGVRLYIDNRLVIDKWQDQGATAWSFTEYLSSGEHNIRMEYYENQYDAVAKLNWEATTDQTPPVINNWVGEYYNNKSLEGAPTLVRDDQSIDFNWGLNAPEPTINPDKFSVRWLKTEILETSTYRFNITSDDGVRLYIDDELVLYEWNDHSATTYIIEKSMTTGPHDFRLEYYENTYDAIAKFSLEKISGPPSSDNFSAEYFANMSLSGPPVFTVNELAVNHSWGLNAPAPAVPADNFSARWTKQTLLNSGVYKFRVTADDGVRLYIDNTLIIDKWIDQSTTTYSYNMLLTEGLHTIRMEYYENSFDAVAILSYVPTQEQPDNPPIVDPGWSAQYFDNKNLSGLALITQNDAVINYYWGPNAPLASMPIDNFSVRWTKTLVYSAGDYIISTTSDDGMRVYVDGVLVINEWNDHGVTTFETTINLTAAEHTVVVEYYENTHDAVSKAKITKL